MSEEELIDKLCIERLRGRGYVVRKPEEGGMDKVEIIKHRVAAYYGVKVSDIMARTRTATVVKARKMGMYLARKLTKMSLLEIAREFNRDDHGTVQWAHGVVDRLIHNGDKAAREAALDISNGLR